MRLKLLNYLAILQWTKKLIEAERLSPSTPVSLELTLEEASKIIAVSQESWRKAANYLHIWAARKAKQLSTKDDKK